jgi:integral membrane sensor domain MASE1
VNYWKLCSIENKKDKVIILTVIGFDDWFWWVFIGGILLGAFIMGLIWKISNWLNDNDIYKY